VPTKKSEEIKKAAN